MRTDSRVASRVGLAVALVLPFAFVACGDDDGGTTPPTTGNLEANAATTGDDIDPDGYTVVVDGGTGQAIGVNGSHTFTGLTAGNHTVQLNDVAANCTVAGDNPRTVAVTGGATASTTFNVTCTSLAGAIEVTAATTGDDQDDAYTVAVDGGTAQPIDANGTVTFSDLAAGSYSVELGDVAANCTVAGSNPRDVTVTTGSTAQTTFDVACTSQVGDLDVTTATSGFAAPTGYDYTVDSGAAQAIGASETQTTTGLAVGDHVVELLNVPANCTVSGDNPVTVSVPLGGTGTATFNVTCAGGSVDVTTASTGLGIDAGYQVAVGTGTPQAIGANDAATISDQPAGTVDVTLSDVAANCSVEGDNPVSVTIPGDGTSTAARFDVFCFQALDNQVAFESDRDGNEEIYVMTPDGSGQTNLTNNSASDRNPAVSPDGSEIVFQSNRDGSTYLWKMSAAGFSKLTGQVAQERHPSYATNFSGIAYQRRATNWEIWKVNVNGTTPTQLSSGAGDDTQPAYSPDGNWVAFRSDRDDPGGTGEIYVVNVSTLAETRLTNDAFEDGKPAWTADGSKLLWVNNSTGDFEIYEAAFTAGTPPTLGAPTNLTNDAVNDDLMPDMNNAGTKIMFVKGTEVWRMDPDGSSQSGSTATGDNNLEPDWGP